MLLGSCFIRDNHLIIRDVDGSEVAFSATDALDLQDELHKHRVQLLEIAHQPHEPMFNARQALTEERADAMSLDNRTQEYVLAHSGKRCAVIRMSKEEMNQCYAEVKRDLASHITDTDGRSRTIELTNGTIIEVWGVSNPATFRHYDLCEITEAAYNALPHKHRRLFDQLDESTAAIITGKIKVQEIEGN